MRKKGVQQAATATETGAAACLVADRPHQIEFRTGKSYRLNKAGTAIQPTNGANAVTVTRNVGTRNSRRQKHILWCAFLLQNQFLSFPRGAVDQRRGHSVLGCLRLWLRCGGSEPLQRVIMAADTLTVKLKFANKLRRIRVEQPVDKLKIFYVLRDSNYPEYKNMLPSNLDLFELAYSDEEGDTVALTDSIDFKEAFAFFANANKIPCFSVQIKNEAGSYIHHEAFAEEDLTPASHSPPSNDSVEGFGDRPPLPSGMSLLGSSGSYSAFPSGSAFSSPGLGVPSLGGLLAPQSSGINFGNLLPPAGSASDANGLGSSSDLAGSNLSSLSLAFDGHSADPTFQRDNSAESLSAAPFSSSTLYGGSGSQLSTSAPSYSGAFNSNAPAFTSSGTKLFNSQGFGSQGPFFGQNQVDPQQRNAQPFIPGTSLSDESEKSRYAKCVLCSCALVGRSS